MDLLLHGGTIVPVDPARSVFAGDVLIREGYVVGVGPDLSAQAIKPALSVDVRGMAVLPAFVQSRVQLAHTLFRNSVDGTGSATEVTWRREAALSADAVRAAARLGAAGLLLSGTTSVLDVGSVRHTEALFEAARDLGLRFTSGKIMFEASADRPAPLQESSRAALAEAERLRKVWHRSAGGRLRYAYAPYDVQCCSEELLVEVIGRARAAGCLLHVRAAETSAAVDEVRSKFGSDPIAHLHEVGLTGRDVVLAHCVWLTAREQKLLRESNTSVAHCPMADLRSAAGVAKVPELVAQGVRVSLGAGGAPHASCLDLFETLRATALIHRVRASSSTLTPYQLIEMATLRGAEALGLDQELGSLAAGKRADVIVVDLRGVHVRPAGDVLSALVYACRGSDVRHVLIDGQFAVRDGVLQTADLAAIHDEAERAAVALRRRSG